MQRYKTLIIFLVLTAVWSALFTTVKFFLWGDLRETLAPDLQTLAGYLSLGGVISYFIGGAIAYTFLKKYVLFFVSLFTLILVIVAYIVGFDNNFILGFVMISIGIFYGLWSVVKNILIAVEIKKTGLPDTTVNALVGIVFVIFIILGSILGGVLVENMGKQGFLVIIAMLVFTSVISLTLNYDKLTLKELLKNGIKSYYHDRERKFLDSMKDYIPDVVYISKKYYLVILTSSFLWAISTIVSQKAVEFSIDNFDMKQAEATMVMLYSAVGVIIGNIGSAKMDKNRWKYFRIFNTLFALLVFTFPFLGVSFLMVSIIAFVIGIFFGIASNLVDAFFFKKIGDENKKEYGASTYGLILSFVIFVMMFISTYVNDLFSFEILMIFLGLIVLGLSFLKFNEN